MEQNRGSEPEPARADGGEAAAAKDGDAGDGLGVMWVVPAALLLAAKGLRRLGGHGVLDVAIAGLVGLAAAVTVAVLVTALRRRAYETLTTMAAGALFAGTLAYLKGDLF